MQLSTVLLLGLAANTSYGGLPVLMARLAQDGALPHVLGLRADRQVYRQGILLLSGLSGILLLFSAGQVAVLVPLFAIGVFIGFALSQAGIGCGSGSGAGGYVSRSTPPVRSSRRPRRWWWCRSRSSPPGPGWSCWWCRCSSPGSA